MLEDVDTRVMLLELPTTKKVRMAMGGCQERRPFVAPSFWLQDLDRLARTLATPATSPPRAATPADANMSVFGQNRRWSQHPKPA